MLQDGKLHTAIEIQQSHANSASKREAFATHGVVDVQIEVSNIKMFIPLGLALSSGASRGRPAS